MENCSCDHKPCPRHIRTKTKTRTITDKSPWPCNTSSETPSSIVIPNSEIETSIAVGRNPLRCEHKHEHAHAHAHAPMVVICYQQDRYSSGGGSNNVYMKISLDGGKCFSEPIPMKNVKCYGGQFERDTNPHVAIDGAGDIYFSSLPFDFLGTLSDVAVAKYSVKKGKFLYNKYLDLEELPLGTDYDTISVDPQSPCKKAVYATWSVVAIEPVDGRFISTVRFAKTVDGENWSAPVIVIPEEPVGDDVQAQVPAHALLPNPCKKFSRIVVVYALVFGSNGDGPVSLQFRSSWSIDQGNTWSPSVPITPPDAPSEVANGIAIDPDTLPDYIPIRSANTVPILASDRKRNILYLATQENSLVVNDIPCGIFLYVTLDGGVNWIPLGQINRVPEVQAYNQSLVVLDNGILAVSYYDLRNYAGSDVSAPLLTDRWQDFYCYDSQTGTLTFIKEERLTKESFDTRKAPLLTSGTALVPAGYFLGDYMEQANYKGKLYNSYPVVPEIYFNNPANAKLSVIDYE